MVNCRVCLNTNVDSLLNLGLQPICNRYLTTLTASEDTYPFILGLCGKCGTVQQTSPLPATEFVPRYSWITYVEPENHLDSVAEALAAILAKMNFTTPPRICALTYKSGSLLARLEKKGFSCRILDPLHDLEINNGYGGTDAVQHVFNEEQAHRIVARHGAFDVVITRHVLEHVYDFQQFFTGIKALLSPRGIAMFEVPDYTTPFEQFDYSTLWEEHITYFTPETFKLLLPAAGFSVIKFDIHQYPLENCLVAFARPAVPEEIKLRAENIEPEKKRAMRFAAQFQRKKQEIIQAFTDWRNKGKKIAVYGAGHNACFLLNIFGLKDLVTCVVDDHPEKKGLFLPGSRLPIVPSTQLNDLDICAFCLNPATEEKIIANKNEFIDKGGVFVSLCPVSPRALSKQGGNTTEGKFARQQFRAISPEVMLAEGSVKKITKNDLIAVKQNAVASTKKRSRICAHPTAKSAIHEMLITLDRETYVRPHRHKGKAESFHIIEGSAYVIIFTETGEIKEAIHLGAYDSGEAFYYRLDDHLYHTVIPLTRQLVFHETTKGPFVASETEFAPWSPDEEDIAGQEKFKEDLLQKIRKLNL